MLKYLLLCFSLFTPVRMDMLRNFKPFHSCNSQIIAMTPPPGGISSAMVDDDKFLSLKEGCRIDSEVVHHDNGGTTEVVSVTFIKEVKRDKHGNVVRETDTSTPRYQSARKSFFSSSSSKKN